ncbi:MAG: ATPase, partial [Candidatus Omnitrophota bacterium]
MYKKFYGFSEKPFNMTPDSKFFFPSSKHTEALSSLLYSINERKGFVMITGEIGAGKTTVSRTL